ncbi:hypothetical protein [Pectobacterium punjabense]|uniref:hypothetical protein n=1 Tax=Pectobacterium punjabense TaxID=2108399 RepID=UPI003D9B88F2
MSYKYKSTMYYSDEDTKIFLKERTRKPGGGKGTESKFLYSLVTSEREKVNSEQSDNEINNGKSRSLCKLDQPYRPRYEMITSNNIEFSSLAAMMKNDKKTIPKAFMKGIDDAIYLDYIKKIKSLNLQQEEGFFIILKTYITCRYNDFNSSDVNCKGTFTARWVLILVDRALWDKFGGLYDFTKIKYLKYIDISNGRKGVPSGICKVHDSHEKDDKGAFFIPVRSTAKAFPSELKYRGKYFIQGVDAYSIKNRVDIKPMTEYQKSKFDDKSF